eukprot:196440_1
MKRFHLDETSANLKIKLKMSKFYGEASFIRNANISAGTCIPVLLKNNNNEIYIHTMKWGIDIFNTGKSLTSIARNESINNTTWSPLINSNQKCIIVCKGFYLWQSTEILDIKKRTKKTDRQPFFVTPNKLTEGEFFYILGLYKETRSYKGRSFACVAISQSVSNHPKYIGYVERIPLFCRKNQINNWLFSNNNNSNINFKLFTKNNISTNKFLKIGLWVNFPEEMDYRDENIVLQSRFQWNLETEAKMIGFEDGDFNFDEIEKKALEQNELNKYNNNNNNTNNTSNDIANDNEEEELKQEEQYSFNDYDSDNENQTIENIKKRQRNDINDINDINNQPPNKKQKIMINVNEN